jgi:hypothetical protein
VSRRNLACAILAVIGVAAFAAALLGCIAQPDLPTLDPGLGQLTVTALQPAVVLPSTEIDVAGRSFVDASRGSSRLRLRATFTSGGAALDVDLQLTATFVDEHHMTATADAQFLAALPSRHGHLDGQATVLVDSPLDGATHESAAAPFAFDVIEQLTPRLDGVKGGTLFVNGAVTLSGDGFLLGTSEGATHAIVDGCFSPTGQKSCAKIATVDLVASPSTPWDRAHLTFPFAPAIAGIAPGTFTGTVHVVAEPAAGGSLDAGTQPLTVTLKRPAVTRIAPTAASLGQYVDIQGGGFVGAADDEATLLHLVGSFAPDGAPPQPVDLELVPGFVSGAHLRYVLDETDALGQAIDLRQITGRFDGKATPIVRKGTIEVVGDTAGVSLTIAPVKQVVYLNFLPSYVESLRRYGLEALDDALRARVFAVAARDYAGLNVEFRATVPDDFALYSQVDIAGPDPNDKGFFGYDNTPGKDVGNQRLFDRIGGVNATTQSDGEAGFGGVFTEQFLSFSQHPGAQVAEGPTPSAIFDRIFDPMRPETGTPASHDEAANVPRISDGFICPAAAYDRTATLACAVFVLGNLIGTTLTHEVGHSLGLADPTGDLFHDPGDRPNRLMDSGDARPFAERAELMGQGPGVFCDDEFVYLESILPVAGAAPTVHRPGCN